MKYNTKYGVVAALTLAAFVAPSVGAFSGNTYTKAEEDAIQACISGTKPAALKGKVTESAGTVSDTTKYTGVTGTIYAGISLNDQTDTTGIRREICIIDLQYNGTLIEDSTKVTQKQGAVAGAEAEIVRYYGGGDKNDTQTDYGTSVAANMVDGVYKYVGNYKGEIKTAEDNVEKKKEAIKALNTELTRAQGDLADAIQEAKDVLGENATETQINGYAAVKTAKAALDNAEKAIAEANDSETEDAKGLKGLKQLEKIVKEKKDAGVKAEKALSRAKADLATAKAENAKDKAEEADRTLSTEKVTLKTFQKELEEATTEAAVTAAKEKIEKQEAKIAAIEGKIKALNNVAAKAEAEANNAAEAAKDDDKSVSSATISGVKRAYTYTGKAIKPAVTVTKAGATLVEGTDYTVGYKNNTKVGTATITITGKGAYTGSTSKSFYVDPAKSSVKKVSVGAKKMTVTVKKGTAASGVQIGYRVKGTSKWSYTKTTSTSKTIKSLKKGKKYQIVVRSYTTKSGKVTNYSGWSATKTTAKIK